MDINTNAPVTVELGIDVAAPPATVWWLHTDIDGWTSWHPDISAAVLHGDLRVGSVFDWTTGGLDITSTVGELIPERRIVWGGETHGIDGLHVWTFEPCATGVTVRTRESWDGDPCWPTSTACAVHCTRRSSPGSKPSSRPPRSSPMEGR
jgi:uncharacterized protein YndB with AHSA1/START domain